MDEVGEAGAKAPAGAREPKVSIQYGGSPSFSKSKPRGKERHRSNGFSQFCTTKTHHSKYGLVQAKRCYHTFTRNYQASKHDPAPGRPTTRGWANCGKCSLTTLNHCN